MAQELVFDLKIATREPISPPGGCWQQLLALSHVLRLGRTVEIEMVSQGSIHEAAIQECFVLKGNNKRGTTF
jgi:hypothetical protein